MNTEAFSKRNGDFTNDFADTAAICCLKTYEKRRIEVSDMFV